MYDFSKKNTARENVKGLNSTHTFGNKNFLPPVLHQGTFKSAEGLNGSAGEAAAEEGVEFQGTFKRDLTSNAEAGTELFSAPASGSLKPPVLLHGTFNRDLGSKADEAAESAALLPSVLALASGSLKPPVLLQGTFNKDLMSTGAEALCWFCGSFVAADAISPPTAIFVAVDAGAAAAKAPVPPNSSYLPRSVECQEESSKT